jgi:hypothetical protein
MLAGSPAPDDEMSPCIAITLAALPVARGHPRSSRTGGRSGLLANRMAKAHKQGRLKLEGPGFVTTCIAVVRNNSAAPGVKR